MSMNAWESVVVALGIMWFISIAAYVLLVGYGTMEQIKPSPAINNATVINNYYCNTTEPFPDDAYVQDYIYNETSKEVENVTCATRQPAFSYFTPIPTPAYCFENIGYNGSVGTLCVTYENRSRSDDRTTQI